MSDPNNPNDPKNPNNQNTDVEYEDQYLDDSMDMSLAEFNKIQRAQLILREALMNEQEEAFLLALEEHNREKLKSLSAESLPLYTSNPYLIANNADLIIETYPKLSAKIDREIEGISSRKLLENAGYSDKQINQVAEASSDFMESIAVTSLHEEKFGFKGDSLKDRLSATKDSVLNQLGKPGTQKALQVAGIAIGCATGGIVITAGMKASGMLANKLAKTPGFQSLMSGLTDSAEKVASKLTGKPVAEIREKTKRTKEAVSKTFKKRYVAIPAVLIAGYFLGQTDLAQEMMASVANTAGTAFDQTVDAVSPLAEKVGSGVSAGAGKAGEYLSSFSESIKPSYEGFQRGAPGISVSDASLDAFAQTSLDEGLVSRADGSIEALSQVAEADMDLGVYTIESGDNLWNIAKSHLELSGLEVNNRSIYEATQAIYEANAELIGDNPDLIMPGVEISIPDSMLPAAEVPELACPAPEAPSNELVAEVSSGLTWGDMSLDEMIEKMKTPGLDDNNGVINLDKEPAAAAQRKPWDPDPADF